MLLFAVGVTVLALVAAVLLAWNARLPSSIQVAAWAAQPPPPTPTPTRPSRPPGHPGRGRSAA